MRKTKAMTEATTLSCWLLKRVPKKSGIVRLSMCCVMSLVRLPRTSQASNEPMTAFPIPIQADDSPYFHPNCPA